MRLFIPSFLRATLCITGCSLIGAFSDPPAPPDDYYTEQDFYTVKKMDVHVHINTNRPDLVAQAEADRFVLVAMNVDVPYFPTVAQQQAYALQQAAVAGDNIHYLTAFEARGMNEPGWSSRQLAYLKKSFDQGALGVKVWKNIGMTVKDKDSNFILIDNPVFGPIFDYLEQNNIPVCGHIGEPKNCWLPLDQMTTNNDRSYFAGHPEYHMYLHPEYPSYETIIQSRDHLLEKHPKLRFLGAHLGSLEWDVDEIAKRLDKFPNMTVEPAERLGQLQYQTIKDREKVRNFYIKYQDRIMYGTDLQDDDAKVPGEVRQRAHDLWLRDWRYFTTDEVLESPTVNGKFRGLKLPREVIDKIYFRNAQRWYLSSREAGSTSRKAGSTSRKAGSPAHNGWEKLGPGGGGFTYMPTFSYNSPDDFLVRCDMTGSYLTRNGGGSYQQINFANGASAYAYDPHDSNRIYIGSAGLHRSTDGGQTWEQIFPLKTAIKREYFRGDEAEYGIETTDSSLYSDEFGSIRNIRVDPSQAAALYFSMGPYFYYTSDAGRSWRREQLQQAIEYIYTNKGDLVFIYTATTLYLFNTSNRTFTHKQLPAGMTPAFSFTGGVKAHTDSVVFYALHHHRMSVSEDFAPTQLWVSGDKGNTWRPATDPDVTDRHGEIITSYSHVSCAEWDAAHAYLVSNVYEEKKAGGTSRYWYGALKTSDAGSSWSWVWKGGGGSGRYGVKDGKGVANLTDAWAEKAFGGEFIQVANAGVFPGDGKIAILTDWYRTMKTMDGGRTWVQITSDPQPDGSFSSRGMDVTTTYGVHFDPFDSAHIVVSYTDLGSLQSYNGGKSWSRSVEGVPNEWVNTCFWVVFDPTIKGKLWSAWSGIHDIPRTKMTRNADWKQRCIGGICVSTDGGKTWKPGNAGMGNDASTTSVVLDPRSPAGRRTLYATVYNKGVFKSTDDGKTWRLMNKGMDANTSAFELTLAGNGHLFLTVSPVPIFKEGKVRRAFHSGAVYKSTDGAQTWTKLHIVDGRPTFPKRPVSPSRPIFPNGMDVDPEDPERIYLACWSDLVLSDLIGRKAAIATGGNKNLGMEGGIFLSENGGKTWKPIFDKEQYVYDVTADPYHKGRVYCNTFNKGAYRSDDYGKTWKKLKGYDFHWGHRIIIDKNDTEKVYITTFGSSVWHGRPEVEQ